MSPKNQRDPETGLPIISTPNGKRWAWETIGKAVAAVLVLIAVAVWSRAIVIYGLPPRVDKAEEAIKSLQVLVASPRPMSSPEVDALAAALVARMPAAKKGR